MTASAPDGRAPSLPEWRRWLLTAGAMLTMAVSYFDRQTFAALAPTVTAALAIRDDAYGTLVSAFSVAYLVGSPLAGRVVDRFGARRALVVAVLIWSAVAALHSLAASFLSLLLLRVLLGLAESPSFPGSAQTVTRALRPEQRARGIGILFTGSSLGALIAPLAASSVERRHGWQLAFLVTAVAGLVWIPMWLALTSGAARAQLDRPPAAAPTTPEAPKLGIAATLALPPVLRGMAVIAASAPLAGFVLNWSAKYLLAAHGVTQGDMGRYLWIPPVLFDIGAVGFGHFTSRLIRSPQKTRALMALAGGMASALALVALVPGPGAAMVFAGVALAGVAGLFAMVTADMLSRVPGGAVSTTSGISAATQSLAYIVANQLIGIAVEQTRSYTGTILVLSAVVVPGVLTFLLWRLPDPDPSALSQGLAKSAEPHPDDHSQASP